MKIDLEERERDIVLGLAVSRASALAAASTASSDQEFSRRLGLGIAHTIFEAAGGSFTVEHSAECWSVEVRLPREAKRSS